MSFLATYGSGECDQLAIEDKYEISKPLRIPFFQEVHEQRIVKQIVCGGLHTVALSTQGLVFTWGCNDDGALGRQGIENLPA